jgi:hypothetical protein
MSGSESEQADAAGAEEFAIDRKQGTLDDGKNRERVWGFDWPED